MNGYIRALFAIPYAYIKLYGLKVINGRYICFGSLPRISLLTEITVEKGATFSVGNRFNMRGSARIRVRKGGKLLIGNNVSININNMIGCHEKIVIGNDVQFSPNVQIYDHDHDYEAEGGIAAGKYKTSPIEIGSNCWIGANTVILRGTKLGNNCVVGAGCIIKGIYPDDSVIIQKREMVKR